MNITIWSKTLLSVYPKLPKLISAIDKSIDKLICKSAIASNDANIIVNNIRLLIKHKKELQLIEELLNEAFLDENKYDVLIARHINHTPFKDLADKMNTYIRAVFRKHEYQLKSLSDFLLSKDYDELECEEVWGDNRIINQARYSILKTINEDEIDGQCYILYNIDGSSQIQDVGSMDNNTYYPYLSAFI